MVADDSLADRCVRATRRCYLGAHGQPNRIAGVVAAAVGVAAASGLPSAADYVYHVPYFLADGDERRHSVLRVGCNRCHFFFDFEITGIDDAGNVFGPVHVGDPAVGLEPPETSRTTTTSRLRTSNAVTPKKGYPRGWATATAIGG